MPVKVSEIRKLYPMYDSYSDDQLLSAVHRKFYSDMPIGEFVKNIDYDTGRQQLQQQTLQDMGAPGRFAAGAGHEVQQLVNTAKRLNPYSDYTQADAQREAREAAPLMDTTAGKLGGLAGDVALQYLGGGLARGAGALAGKAGVSVPSVLPNAIANAKGFGGAVRDVASNALQGAGWGAALSPDDPTHGAALGGTVAGALGAGFRGAGALLTGPLRNVTSAAAQKLQDMGVNVPLWKATDIPWVRRIGERIRAAPGVGDVMKGQEREALIDYNRAFTQSAAPRIPVLDEAGNVLRWEQPEINGVGQQGMQQLHDAWNAHYAPMKDKVIPLDQQLMNEMHGIADYAENYRSGSAAKVNETLKEVNSIFDAATNRQAGAKSVILDAQGTPIQHPDIAGHAGVTGDDYAKALDAVQKQISSSWGTGTDVETARLLTQMRESLHDARFRNAPPELSEIGSQEARNAYKNYDLLRRASSSLGAVRNDGLVTPAQAISAVKAKDTSYAKGATTRGEAWGQDVHQNANSVLGSELPDVGPGTAEKMWLPTLLTGLSGGAGLAGAAKLSGGIALPMALATRQGQKALQGGYPIQNALRPYVDPMADYLAKLGVAGAVQNPSNTPGNNR